MAEIKTGIFAKNVQKRLSRAQEKVLQKLGKADETKDEQFEQCVQNFKRQESEGSRLQREMRAYLTAVKAMQQASINLTESLHEVYEPDWHGKDDVMTIGKDCDALWEDFHQKLVDSTIITLDNYLQQFPDLKIRVAKRSRKLIDFDSARHHLETLQASTMRNDRKIVKAEDELKKAQKVFDELNVGLQDELPTLWDSRVGFYVNTFKSVTHIEAKFHREISLLCKQLYEVMTKLGEQHSDKMFTIQGAPSDSGPLRLARTPSPPSDDSPPDSPVASPNHSLRPVSPGPPRPKSPSQLRKGPPVPPPPKVTPTKELHQEQIINLFGDEFLPPPAMSPSLPNERPGESLMDMDFDPFTPNTPMGQPVSPVGQALPWDMWTANVEPAQPPDSGSVRTVGAEERGGCSDPSSTTDFNPGFPAFPEQGGDSGFVADWAADFGPTPENGDSVPAAAEAAARQAPTAGQEEAQDGAQSWHQADGWGGDTGEAAVAAQPQEREAASGDEVSGWDPNPQPNPNCYLSGEEGGQSMQETGQRPSEVGPGGWEAGLEEGGADPGAEEAGRGDRRKSTPGLRITNEHDQEIEDTTEGSEHGLYLTQGGRDGSTPERGLSGLADLDGSGSEYETAQEWGDGIGHGDGWASADDEPAPTDALADQDSTSAQGGFADWASGDLTDQNEHAQESRFGNDAFAPDWAQTTDQASIQPAETEIISVPEHSQSAAESFNSTNLFSVGKDPFEHTGVPLEDSLSREKVIGFASASFFNTFGGLEGLETHGGGGFEPNTSTETLGKDGMSGFESDPFAEIQGGGGFESDPFAETQGGGGFESDPFAATQGGGGFESDPFAATQGGGFESDPFAETQGGGGFESDPFAETQGGGGFESDPFAETQGGGGFEVDSFAETQGHAVEQGFSTDLFVNTQGGGGFESDPFTNTKEGSGVAGDFATDPFAETTTEGGTSWAADPFGNTPSAGTEGATNNTGSWQEVSDSSGFFSDGQRDFLAFPGAGGSEGAAKEVSTPRAHKEPENSDLSEDEVANRRYGKLYQEIDTEKEEVTNNAFNGFSQDSSAPAFFADFDKMNESTGVPATAATEADVDTITAVATEAAEGAAACETEAGPEAVAEATPEAAPEAVPEARPEAAPEARPEAAPEARPEAAPEARPEAAPETGPETAEGQEPAASTEEAEETRSSTAPKEKTPASPVESPDEPAATEGAEQAEVLPVEEAETPPPIEEVPLECVANPEERKEPPLEEAPTVVAEPVDENPKEATVATTEGPAEVGPEEEKMPIPSVVIEPASSNEGDDDRDGDIISPTTISDNGVAPDNQPAKDISSSGGFPLDFMYKVETLHDFEAANSDELELKKGDIVLVVPTALAEDQDAGWLTGMKESEWSQLGADAHKGLFPENFTQRLD
ncbi:amphiphysin isoform X3 [Osmerus eperlanus]|uniref:amphiphysin isoform X3 n=1 Tax=Osmerus eperlanus TaxID=29151 RepID=UPI002E154860